MDLKDVPLRPGDTITFIHGAIVHHLDGSADYYGIERKPAVLSLPPNNNCHEITNIYVKNGKVVVEFEDGK